MLDCNCGARRGPLAIGKEQRSAKRRQWGRTPTRVRNHGGRMGERGEPDETPTSSACVAEEGMQAAWFGREIG